VNVSVFMGMRMLVRFVAMRVTMAMPCSIGMHMIMLAIFALHFHFARTATAGYTHLHFLQTMNTLMNSSLRA
jgi:hypothetical protein